MAEVKRNIRVPKASKTKQTDEYGHLQPQAPELEEAVLGALMIEKDAYSLVSEILRPESFYEHRNHVPVHRYQSCAAPESEYRSRILPLAARRDFVRPVRGVEQFPQAHPAGLSVDHVRVLQSLSWR